MEMDRLGVKNVQEWKPMEWGEWRGDGVNEMEMEVKRMDTRLFRTRSKEGGDK